ncbi:hypothetical protein AAFF_G00113670 [Aldrovandia affinis]|uniref:Uncharacterized protein n=1 Tax=Aldrovandia affinis TaxID=143900 RepID=A0AAD7RTJ1_9TELE|nr:hypothetical protein AAFF_G00113670 [Aldrovandia affinis]
MENIVSLDSQTLPNNDRVCSLKLIGLSPPGLCARLEASSSPPFIILQTGHYPALMQLRSAYHEWPRDTRRMESRESKRKSSGEGKVPDKGRSTYDILRRPSPAKAKVLQSLLNPPLKKTIKSPCVFTLDGHPEAVFTPETQCDAEQERIKLAGDVADCRCSSVPLDEVGLRGLKRSARARRASAAWKPSNKRAPCAAEAF